MITIPRTTLLCIDCQFPALAARALTLSLAQCDFPAVRFLTDAGETLAGLDPRIRVVPIPRITSSAAYSRLVLKGLLDHVETDFVQIVQWDGHVTRGEAWQDAFLDYDYIGARWWFYKDGHDVGNGGFSLRSRRLLEALRDDAIDTKEIEDRAICRTHRDFLERRYGIRFAPASVADQYAFEGTRPSGREFGFHRSYNLPHFNDEAGLAQVLESVPDDKFCSGASVTLVEKLIQAGRRREALRCALRMRGQGYRTVAVVLRDRLLGMMRDLADPAHSCPCGSGTPYGRCCGAAANWTA